MKVQVAESRTVYVHDEDGREIVTLTVGRIPAIENGYGVDLVLAQGSSDALQMEWIAATKPPPRAGPHEIS